MKILEIINEHIFQDSIGFTDERVGTLARMSVGRIKQLGIDQLKALGQEIKQTQQYAIDQHDKHLDELREYIEEIYPDNITTDVTSAFNDEFVISVNGKHWIVDVSDKLKADSAVKEHILSIKRYSVYYDKLLDLEAVTIETLVEKIHENK